MDSVPPPSDDVVSVPKTLAARFGWAEAAFLAQLEWLIANKKPCTAVVDGERWVVRSDSDWASDGFDAGLTFRLREKLREPGKKWSRPLVECRTADADGRRTLLTRPLINVRNSSRKRDESRPTHRENATSSSGIRDGSSRNRDEPIAESRSAPSSKKHEEFVDAAAAAEPAQLDTKQAIRDAADEVERQGALKTTNHQLRGWFRKIVQELDDAGELAEFDSTEALAAHLVTMGTQPRGREERRDAKIRDFFGITRQGQQRIRADMIDRARNNRNRWIECPRCHGQRHLFDEVDRETNTVPICPSCSGQGRVPHADTKPDPDAVRIEQLRAVGDSLADLHPKAAENYRSKADELERRRAGSGTG